MIRRKVVFCAAGDSTQFDTAEAAVAKEEQADLMRLYGTYDSSSDLARKLEVASFIRFNFGGIKAIMEASKIPETWVCCDGEQSVDDKCPRCGDRY